MKKKTCTKCRLSKSISEFYTHKSGKDGIHPSCKKCVNAKCREHNKTPEGKATFAWSDIKKRAGNASGNYPTYIGVELRITQEEFKAWYIPEMARWLAENPGVVGTVDRQNNKGHYEINNLRIATKADQAKNRGCNTNINAPAGMAHCGRCKQYKSTNEFCRNRRNQHGLSHRCKKCHVAQVQESRRKKKQVI